MLQIRCPWCGPREENEFHYGGEAHIAYPGSEADDAACRAGKRRRERHHLAEEGPRAADEGVHLHGDGHEADEAQDHDDRQRDDVRLDLIATQRRHEQSQRNKERGGEGRAEVAPGHAAPVGREAR